MIEWFVPLQGSSPAVSQLASTSGGQGSAVLLVVMLVVLTAIHRIAELAPPSRISTLSRGVEIVIPPLLVGCLIAIGQSIVNAIR